ncbi:D-alanyl-D-alanine carboxypeptidase [Streptomyces sp. NPDC096012]|uniref:D-alanyl-D-alanine carboxypeptidase n=1 Tax=Streptomyces sp. NPDC096012 TaxID=3155684 RepID=UPI003369F73A
MEEASVAGESPDRSKQRESSAEPTSGSGDPVPEARDPRLSVAREKDSSGGVSDTATRVLSVRDAERRPTPAEPAKAPEPAGAEDAGAEDAGAEDAAGDAGDSGSRQRPKQDAALREAVSAWVRGADGTTGEQQRKADATAKAGKSGDSESAGTEADERTDADSKGGLGSKAVTDAGSKGDAGAKADADTKADTKAEVGAEADADAEAGTSAKTGPEPKADAKPKTDPEPKADAKPKTDPEPKADAKPKTDPEPEADAKPKTDPEPEADAKPKTDPEPEADAKPKTDPEPKTDVKPAADADAGGDADARGEGTTDARGDEGTGEGETGEAKASKDEASEDAPAEDGEDDEDGEDRDVAPAGPHVDQPTAVFKAPRPKKPEVDQPTTMLKLGGTPKAPAPNAPESDSERTSKFVALKDDMRPGVRPRPATKPAGTGRDSGKPGTTGPGTTGPGTTKPGTTGPGTTGPGTTKPGTTGPGTAKPGTTGPGSKSAGTGTAGAGAAGAAAAGAGAAGAGRDVAKAEATTVLPQVGPERTTQQPLPPKPPLDLLAELTNTPPPPETPVRTFVRRVKIWTPLVLLLAIVVAVVQAVRPLPSPTLALTAEDSYTFGGGKTNLPWPGEGQGWIDGDGIGTMGSFGKQTPVAIGSVAKTMTAYIILRDHPLKPGQEGPQIAIDPKAEKEGGYNKVGESTLNTVKAGDHLTEKQALSAVIIPSANNIARLLARWDAGSEAAFVKKMNATARELGLSHTTYTDPSGLMETTVSTAEDQVKLGRAFVKVPALVAISSAASWTDPSGRFWPNYNELPFHIGAIGIKTGSTSKAGGNLLFASRKQVGGQTVTIVGAILGQHKPDILKTANEVSQTALLAAQSALTSAKILKKGDVVGYVDDRLGGHTPVVITQDVTAVGWAGLKVRLSFVSGAVTHTAKAGTKVGTLTVGDGTARSVKVPVALQKDLAEPGFGAKLTRLG